MMAASHGVARIRTNESGIVVVTAGYLSPSCCDIVWVTNQAKFESLKGASTACVISASSDSRLKLRSGPASNDNAIRHFSANAELNVKSGDFAALMFRFTHVPNREFLPMKGEDLITSEPPGKLNLGHVVKGDSNLVPIVQVDPEINSFQGIETCFHSADQKSGHGQ
jgi:hypothetical protein